ncbi:hypothetical protein GGI21_000488 [Coemansia aciculifera]|nr:hypothetical protein GGI21_000488 [Coemansia aciculifera]
MHGLSAFQLLPEHAVKAIVGFLAGETRQLAGDELRYPDDFRKRLLPLLSVCHVFRAYVHALFCENYKVYLVDSYCHISSLLWPSQSLEPKEPGYPSHHLAKKLTLCLDPWTVYTGRAIAQLLSPPYDGGAFPLVRDFSLYFSVGPEEYWEYDSSAYDHYYFERRGYAQPQKTRMEYPPNTASNVAAFVQRVREMAPGVRTIRVEASINADILLRSLCAHTTDLAQQLSDINKARTMITRRSTVLVEYLNLDSIRNLVRVEYDTKNPSSRIISLIRRNAQTLQYIDLMAVEPIPADELIQDPDGGGDWVEYPCLQTLKLEGQNRGSFWQGDVVSTAVPFPSLCHLSIGRDYPFEDDVLFRGNSATLEYLDIGVDAKMVALLKRHNVFTPTGHPRLRHVNICLCEKINPNDSAARFEQLQFALSIAPDASVRGISGLYKLDRGLSLLGSCANVQTLSLPGIQPSIWDVMDIIKSLPLLSYLKTQAPVLRPFPQEMSMNGLADYVRSTYAQMGSCFQRWDFTVAYTKKHPKLTTCMLLLALACPNFDLPRPCYLSPRSWYINEMRNQIKSDGFSQDAPRLLRWLGNK